VAHNTKVEIAPGVEISTMGIGAATFGGLFTSMSDSDASEVVKSAFAHGINYFDTAPHYGKGTSERRLGALLSSYPRNSYILSTKIGRLLVPTTQGADPDFADADSSVERLFDYSAQGVERSLKESLERLGLDSIDIVFVHDPDNHADVAIKEAYPALAKMRDQGIIKAIGIGMNQSAIPTRFVKETDIDTVILAGRYTLLDQSGAQDLLPAALAKGVTVIAAGVYNSGILANPVKGATYDYAPASDEILARAKMISDFLREQGVSLSRAALQYPLRHPVVKALLVGSRSSAEVDANVAAFNEVVPDSVWDALDELLARK
jgi:D-threo-aldose 1-dehydrogenase